MITTAKIKFPDVKWKKITLLIFVLFIVNFLLYIDTINHDFLKDDFRLIVENHRIKDFKSFINSIDSKFFSFPDFPYLHYWRPVSLFTFFIDYKLWGLNPSGFHLFNILLNALNGILIFLIFYFISGKIFYPFFISLFFSVHPSHVEAVSWISGRTDLLVSFFIFSAALLFILFIKRKNTLLYLSSAFLFVLALLSKENAVLFPLFAVGLILILNHMKKRKVGKFFLFILPLFLIDIIYIVLHNKFSDVQNVVISFSLKDIFNIFKTIGVYIKIILTPFSPAPYFSMQDFDIRHIEFYLFFLIALTILVLIVLKRNEYRYSLYSLLFFLFLLPVVNPEFVPTNPGIVIRFAYIPAVFAGIFFIDTFRFLKNKHLKNFYIVFLVLLVSSWTVESFSFQTFFKDENEHYQQLVKHYPDDGSILLPLALQKAKTGNFREALNLVNHALAVNERDQWIDISETAGLLKANLLIISGDELEGKTIAMKILEETEKNEMKFFAFLVLSKYHEKRQEYTTALALLKKAENIGETPDLFYRMSILYAKMKEYKKALFYLGKAKEMNPKIPKYLELNQFILNKQNPQRGHSQK